MNSKPEREISKNVLEFDVNTEYKTDLITGMNFKHLMEKNRAVQKGIEGSYKFIKRYFYDA